MGAIQTIVILIFCIGYSNKIEKNSTYNNKFSGSLGVAFNYPATWNIAEYKNKGLIEIAYNNIVVNRTAKTNRAFNISIQLLSTELDKGALYDLFEKRYVNAVEEMEGLIVHEKKLEIKNINGYEWKQATFQLEYPNAMPNRVKFKHLIHFGKPYSLIVSIENLDDNQLASEINCFLESLRIE